MNGLKRIALYGGSFDPVHIGHIAVANGLSKIFALDEVLFVPVHVAPHKRASVVTPALHRYAMLALATQKEVNLSISTIELDEPERPYTVDTVSRMQAKLGSDVRLFFVMGTDSWMEITTWRNWERLLALTDQIVVTRPGYRWDAAHVTPSIRKTIVDLRGADRESAAREIDENDETKIYLTDAVWMDVSATAIRHAVRESRDSEWLSLVPPPVADYIKKYRLYRDKA